MSLLEDLQKLIHRKPAPKMAPPACPDCTRLRAQIGSLNVALRAERTRRKAAEAVAFPAVFPAKEKP